MKGARLESVCLVRSALALGQCELNGNLRHGEPWAGQFPCRLGAAALFLPILSLLRARHVIPKPTLEY